MLMLVRSISKKGSIGIITLKKEMVQNVKKVQVKEIKRYFIEK
jgi:glycerol-3-phosphate responsive antiterminator